MAQKTYTFQVIVLGRKSQPDTVSTISGRSMFVNNRGDLCICENANPSMFDFRAIACFKTGSWLSAIRMVETSTNTQGNSE